MLGIEEDVVADIRLLQVDSGRGGEGMDSDICPVKGAFFNMSIFNDYHNNLFGYFFALSTVKLGYNRLEHIPLHLQQCHSYN